MMTTLNPRRSDPESRFWVGVEIGVGTIRSGVFGVSGSVLGKAKVSSKLERGPDAVIARVARCIRYAVDDCDLQMESVAGIGVAIPGRIDDAGRLVNSSEMGWNNIPLTDALQAELGIPVKAGQCFELGARGILAQELAALLPRRVGVVFPAPKIGAAVFVNGEFVSVECAAAFGVGHPLAGSIWIDAVPHAVFGKFCGRDFRKALKRYPTGPVRAYALELAARSGAAAAALWRAWDLEMIVLGGGLMDEMTAELAAAALGGFRASTGEPANGEPVWHVSSLGDLASISGAAILARDTVECLT